jgi:AcrR family transcriptional regulator
MMTTGESTLSKRGYHHGDLRAVLVEATRRLVEENGPDHVSIAAACRLAGVSTAAPYKHFRDKTEMLNAVALDGMERQRLQMLDAIDGIPEGSPERVAALGRVYVTFAVSEPGVFRLMFALSGEHQDEPELMAKGEEVFGLVKREVARCTGEPEDSSPVERRSFTLWSFVHGLSFLTIDGKVAKMCGDVPLEPLLDDIARRVLAA